MTAITRSVPREPLPADLRATAIERWGHLNAVVAMTDETPAGEGVLGGSTVAAKDVFFDRDRTPTCGSHAMPTSGAGPAAALERLRRAGASVSLYANLHEWGVGTTSAVTALGAIGNPRDPARMAGGSSGGCAVAVATGMTDLAVGADAGGSIRVPAACCGVVGFKPTFGAVPLAGSAFGDLSVDHVGPLARSVAAARQAFEVMAEIHVEEVDAGIRVGIEDPFFWTRSSTAVAAAAARAAEALENAGASTVPVSISGLDRAASAIGSLLLPDVRRAAGADSEDRRALLQPATRRLLDRVAALTETDIATAREVATEVAAGFDRLFDEVDILVTPTIPVVPPPIEAPIVTLGDGDMHADLAFITWNCPMDLAGLPSLSLPCGEVDGWPVSVSLTGRKGSDALVLAVGIALEDALDRAYVDRIVTND
ncbi:MAG TPA: amidase [Actinomycetota bacterium]|nr:amidase [Actinomycetota bacterium]